MVKSMYAAVAGLKTHQSKMDVIGNNIANVNTYGYKKERASFADTYYATSSAASEPRNNIGGANPSQVGYGVKMSAVNTIVTTGGNAVTDNPTDVMITGNGYFMVGAYNPEGYTNKSSESGVNGQGSLTNLYMTRVGLFNFDGQGSLVDTGSNYVFGYSSVRGVQALKVTDTTTDGDADAEQIAWQYKLVSASNNNDNNNADAGIYTVVAHKATDGTLLGYNVYKGTITDPTNPPANANPVMTLSAGDFDPDTYDSLYIMEPGSKYDDAKLYSVDQNTGYIKNSATGVVESATDKLNAMQIPREYTLNGYLDKNGDPLTVTLYGEKDSVDVVAYKLVETTENGVTTTELKAEDAPIRVTGEEYWSISIPIELKSISIGADGSISGVTEANNVITLGKIAVANVPNPTALEAQGNNYYLAKANTGVIEAFNPGDGATGSLMAGNLEMSNVDLSTEFTDMITTQRGYQANSRIITVTDTMLEELVNLKR